jgi:hypothetical protein
MVNFGPHARMFEVGIHSGEGRRHGDWVRMVIAHIIAKSWGMRMGSIGDRLKSQRYS